MSFLQACCASRAGARVVVQSALAFALVACGSEPAADSVKGSGGASGGGAPSSGGTSSGGGAAGSSGGESGAGGLAGNGGTSGTAAKAPIHAGFGVGPALVSGSVRVIGPTFGVQRVCAGPVCVTGGF